MMILWLYLLCNVVFFPIAYVHLVNQDPNCIGVNEEIIQYVKYCRLKEVNTLFTEDDRKDLLLTTQILNSNEGFLSSRKEFIPQTGDEEKADTFYYNNLILVHTSLTRPYAHRPYGYGVIVYSKQWKLVTNIYANGSPTLKEVVQGYKRYLLDKFSDANSRLHLFKLNKYWTYKTILPYTIYDGGLITYKKPKIIYVHALHLFLGNGLLLALLGSFLYDAINASKNRHESNT